MANYHHERAESEILNILNFTLKNVIYDSSLKQCSFTAVKLSPDFALAIIYVDTFDRQKVNDIVEKLTIAKGVFRNQLAQNMHIHKIPEIKFVKDESIDNSLKIDEILDKI